MPEKLINKRNNSKNLVPFFVIQHLLLNPFNGIIKKNIYPLNMDQKFKDMLFSLGKIQSFGRKDRLA